ncbi:succinyldiaminopimelate transaminase [Thiothrix fructosivorans]|uniref:Succinyldiaminopimelate transaminase n=1 Tax=Thiothrix fructosivorans TaxID=111770 RepID=A0A8B0SE96_9GAMM|nr:succinyldiaminopimelate transaminase [Thiothrix fructosivorans]MBO0614864.1 succinyldiaminopimelate transaminase [Thiothrix fructosivorans]QTX09676.1 succinyldiaminopimelate transaminase [Thiothrix fructosivorans]
MNPDLARLQAYPFERIRTLLQGVSPADLPAVSLAMGEPKHPTPAFIHAAITANMGGLANYPLTKGIAALREAIATWLTRRFQLPEGAVDAEQHVIPVNGTREALFAFAQAVVDRTADAAVVMPNPFYQIYEGAAFLAGAEPVFLNCTVENGFIPDFAAVPAATWQRCQLLYLCSPGNPTGAVMPLATLQQVLKLAEEHDFIVASDECYSELYADEANPPPGLLQAAAAMGNTAWKRCVVFHSLSKRSNAPGMRSGFVAGDAAILQQFLLFRTYHGCAMPPPFQAASVAAWADEAHVLENRVLYRQKFAAVMDILAPVLDVTLPPAGFYLWPKTPVDDTVFTRELFARAHVNVVPGSYLSREADGMNPGANRIRLALVAPLNECIEAAERIRRVVETL